MSDPNLDPTPAEPKPKTKAKLEFLFVDNPHERMIVLRRRASKDKTPKGVAPVLESTNVGRGLGYVRAEYLEGPGANLFGIRQIDPTQIPDGDVARMLQRCTSRQAMIEWRRIEKRPRVVEAISARLANKAAAPDPDEDAPED